MRQRDSGWKNSRVQVCNTFSKPYYNCKCIFQFINQLNVRIKTRPVVPRELKCTCQGCDTYHYHVYVHATVKVCTLHTCIFNIKHNYVIGEKI